MQKDLILTTSDDKIVATVVIDLAQQTITAVGGLMGDNITVMEVKAEFADPTVEEKTKQALAWVQRRESNITKFSSEMNAYLGLKTKITADNGTLLTIPTVAVLEQTIKFTDLVDMAVGDADQALVAVASSGLTVTFASDNTAVATIVSGKLHAVAAGTANITASQAGDSAYLPATPVKQSVTITAAP